jgi:thiosulfate/3-mercaptopyruvate sulfurtransferase
MLAVVAADVAPVVSEIPEHAALLDVRWYLDGTDGQAAFEAGHIPGARWVDLDHDLSATDRPSTEGRHPLPTPTAFAAAMGSLGVGDDTWVVAYDDSGGVTAGRLVVMLRMIGRRASLLDGGLTAWVADGGPIETGPSSPVDPASFTPVPWPAERLVSADEAAAAASHGAAVLDARAEERFTGEVALIDPRAGHVPGARNAPWAALLGDDGRLRSCEQLRDHFASLGADHGDTITYCGSGVSSCLNIVAMEHAGLEPACLYVASWSGWSADPHRPAELGPAR